MAQGKDYVNFILEDKAQIKDFVAKISTSMFDYMNENDDSKYILFYKYLTHADLGTFGKATSVDSLDKNLLYYIKKDEMQNVEERTSRPFQTTHQSCIGLKAKLYDMVGLPNPREVSPYLINNYMNVYLVNDTLEYFKSEHTKAIFELLGKSIPTSGRTMWDFEDLNVQITTEKLTPIDLHVAVHGLGVKDDEEFHKLRHHMFKGDTFVLLFEKSQTKGSSMYILLEKNPVFFSLIGATNKAYEEYQKLLRKRLINKSLSKENAVGEENLDEEVTRQQQSTWRKMLANEMMGYTQVNDEVFCPFTYIGANFNELGALFVASHIKGFKDPNTTNEEKYDINNGLLLCSNADALFDKHLIAINEEKELEFSFLLDENFRLKQQLLLLQPIFKPILNDKRMSYLKYHYQMFKEKEELRKQ